MSFVAVALAAFVTRPAPAANPHAGHHAGHAPAAPTAAARYSTAATTIADLLANPVAKAVIEKHLPGFSAHPMIGRAGPLTLRAIQQFTQGQISNAHLDTIDTELAALPAS